MLSLTMPPHQIAGGNDEGVVHLEKSLVFSKKEQIKSGDSANYQAGVVVDDDRKVKKFIYVFNFITVTVMYSDVEAFRRYFVLSPTRPFVFLKLLLKLTVGRWCVDLFSKVFSKIDEYLAKG